MHCHERLSSDPLYQRLAYSSAAHKMPSQLEIITTLAHALQMMPCCVVLFVNMLLCPCIC